MRGLDSTGRCCCCCVVLECFPAQNSVSASLYSCPFSGGLFKDVDWERCDSDLMQQTLTSKIQAPTGAPAHKATWPNPNPLRVLCLWNRMLQNSCVSFPQHANIDVCGVFSSAWYTNGDYLVLMVSLAIILPLSLLKNLGKWQNNTSIPQNKSENYTFDWKLSTFSVKA